MIRLVWYRFVSIHNVHIMVPGSLMTINSSNSISRTARAFVMNVSLVLDM